MNIIPALLELASRVNQTHEAVMNLAKKFKEQRDTRRDRIIIRGIDRENPKIVSLENYPKPISNGLSLIRDLIVAKFHPEMIILFGAIATSRWTWKSDIDLLIVADTSGRPNLELDIIKAISESEVINKRISRLISPIVAYAERLNDNLVLGQYVFKDIVANGKLLYNTGRFSLAEMRKLEPEQYVTLVEHDFDYRREEAEEFWRSHQRKMSKHQYRRAAFFLYQVVEASCAMIELVHSRYQSKIDRY